MVITCPLGLKINRNGEAKVQNGQPMVNTSWGLLISVLRANFDGTTSKAVPEAPKPEDADGKATFRSGCRVTNVELLDGKMKVDFEESNTGAAQTLSTGLVIAADGSNSGIRKILLPDIKREYAGYMCWRGTVREELIEEKWNDLYAQKATFHFMQRTYMVKLVGSPDSLDRKALLICDQLYHTNRRWRSQQGQTFAQLDLVLQSIVRCVRSDSAFHGYARQIASRHRAARPGSRRELDPTEKAC